MKEFKGYPRPWSMRIKDGMAIFDFDHDGEVPHYRFAECVVSLSTDDEQMDYLMANAQLIVTAPELLEALRQLRDYVEDVCAVSSDDCHEDHPLNLANKAIKKALGKK